MGLSNNIQTDNMSYSFRPYGIEVIILTEIGMPITKTVVQDQRDNDKELIRQLDWANEM